jgi:hypothetical protein
MPDGADLPAFRKAAVRRHEQVERYYLVRQRHCQGARPQCRHRDHDHDYRRYFRPCGCSPSLLLAHSEGRHCYSALGGGPP